MAKPLIIRQILKVVGLLFLVLLGICVFRAVILPKTPVLDDYSLDYKNFVSDRTGLLKRFSDALKFRTVNYNPHDYERDALSEFVNFISRSFPLIHSSPVVSWEVVNNLSLLYYVQGTNKNLKPYMLAGHMDVVPVEESKWSVDPFSGKIDDNFLWGRGTLDCKHLIMGILEALEILLGKGYRPQRSFYIAFGHDEETNGVDGAQHISALLHSRNVKLEYVLDEGGVLVENFVPGVKSPVAFIGISEKGSLNLQLTVDQIPGHSSMPDRETAIVILAKAVSKLEGDVFPSMFGKGPEIQMFEELAHIRKQVPILFPFPADVHASLPLRFILANVWLFKPLIINFMSSPLMSSFHKTSTAVTMIKGGTKMNVLPSSASAMVNLRIHPAQTVDEVKEYVRRIINDERVEISVISSFRPHPVSPVDSFGYFTIKKSIRQIYNDSWVVPSTLIANTDTRWYLELTDSIYRFSLLRLTLKDVKRIHGHDERIAIDNYIKLVNFFVLLIKNSDETIIPRHIHTDL